MIIIGIDPGFDKVGYSLLDLSKKDPQNFKLITSGLIKTIRKDKIENRLKQIYNDLLLLIKKYHPQLLIIEQLFFLKNQKTAIKVSQAQGIILLLASQNNLKVEFLTPLQIKQIITGYGQADKLSIKKMLSLTPFLDIENKEDDEIDAIACSLAYCYQNKNLLK